MGLSPGRRKARDDLGTAITLLTVLFFALFPCGTICVILSVTATCHGAELGSN